MATEAMTFIRKKISRMIRTREDEEHQRNTYAKVMENALLKASNNELKPEVAVRVAWNIANTIDYEDEFTMHATPLTRAERLISRLKDEAFLTGVNNFK